jgi:hypothetical protein
MAVGVLDATELSDRTLDGDVRGKICLEEIAIDFVEVTGACCPLLGFGPCCVVCH